mmetsp:Transcript_11478/g.13913  ORF Transcript_11478/g.13913 Transcript_11478/m.13913 type:complete len:619 (+) Transcript_11478:242-2098(+)|eukprot:CAMPEP_0184016874 /NCGR_PEP_ID=MMETSP0954-20121128/7183_1 /TAXON_ID=627963 /ORGANISM="Aplanochytrium sp, Strain PBS07" /LENGTH=618 /DNA_ID=CAMNT_0026297967 /DNA_START=203 /DNA_END=2059 /DNA_ORIENTATION=+
MGNSPGSQPFSNSFDSDQKRSRLRQRRDSSIAENGRRLFEEFQNIQSQSAKRWSEEIEQGCGIELLLRKEAADLVEKYQITTPIACGMSAVVYKGYNKLTEEKVSIKISRIYVGHGISERQRRKDCKYEAELQKQCQSPYVVQLYDFYLGPRYAIYVMEYVPHTLLERIVERNSEKVYSERETARYIKEIALALEACHKQNVIHLDVKLDNILCTEDGQVKLCDFGVSARIVGKDVKRSVAAPMFSPPEIIREGRCNTKADMWSLGVVLYILLCGYPPFADDGLQKRILKARYTFPAKHWMGVSVMGRDLVSRLLVLDVEQRYNASQVLRHPWIVALDRYRPSKPLPMKHHTDEDIKRLGIARETEEFFAKAKNVTSFLRNMHLCRKLETNGFDLPTTLLDQSDEVLDYLSSKAPAWLDSYLKLNREALQVFKPFRKQLNTMARMYNRTLFVPPDVKQIENASTAGSSVSSPVVASAPTVGSSSKKLSHKAHEALKNTDPTSGMRKSSSTPDFAAMRRQSSYDVVPIEEPVWIPDAEVSYCRLCDTNFNVLQRRHHCRSCGQVVCESCSSQKKVLKHMKDMMRHRCCDLCASHLNISATKHHAGIAKIMPTNQVTITM